MLEGMANERNRVGKAFGEALRAARTEAALTQETLAETADFKASYISMLETAVRQPTITAIIAFEQALGLEAGELVRRTVTAMRGKRIAAPRPRAKVASKK
jgi:transcriptional regulator with XRE-family HTH domain